MVIFGHFFNKNVVFQLVIAFLFNLFSGFWLANFILPEKWKKLSLPLALPIGYIFSTTTLLILCSWLGLPFSIALYSFCVISYTATIVCFCLIDNIKVVFNKEIYFPFVAAAIIFACLLIPAKNSPSIGLYSNCVDGLLYSTFSEYIKQPEEAKETWNCESYNYAKAFSKDGFKDNRESSAYSFAAFSKLLNKQSHECFVVFSVFSYCVFIILIYLFARVILTFSPIAAFLTSIFVGLSPVLAYAVQNNSLSQVHGQFALLFVVFLVSLFFKFKLLKNKKSLLLISTLLLTFIFIFTSYLMVLFYIIFFIIGTIIALLSLKSKKIKWLALSTILASLIFYVIFYNNILNPNILPVQIQKIIAPIPDYNKGDLGDIVTFLNPLYVCGMFDLINPTSLFTSLTFPVMPETFIYILASISIIFMVFGFFTFKRKVKFVLCSVLIGLILIDLVFRFHIQWAYAVKKHLAICVPFVGFLWGAGIVFTFNKIKNYFLKSFIVIVSVLVLVTSGYAVIQTGKYWMQKKSYFNKNVMELMRTIETKVPISKSIFIDNNIFQYIYLLRKYKNLNFYNKNSDYAIIDNDTANNDSTTWFVNTNQHILMIEIENERLIKRLKKTSVPPKVIVGKDDWLFFDGDDVINDYRCNKPFTEKELESYANILVERNEWLKNIGIKFILLIVPNKHSIYSEKLPYNIKKVRLKSRFDQLKEYLQNNTDVKVLDIFPALKEAKKSEFPVYINTDTHWTKFGALIATKQIIDELKKEFPTIRNCNLKDYNFTKKTCEGNLTDAIDSYNSIEGKTVYVKPKTAFKSINATYDFSVPEHFNETICRRMFDKRLPEIFVFRDSFGTSLDRMLSEYFYKSTYVWSYEFLAKPIESEMPDIVIMEVAERLLNKIEILNPEQVRNGYYTIGTNKLSKIGNYSSIIFDDFSNKQINRRFENSFIEDNKLVLENSSNNLAVAFLVTNNIKSNTKYRISFAAKNNDSKSSGQLFLDLVKNNVYDNPEQELNIPCSELTPDWKTFSKVINSENVPNGDILVRIVARNAPLLEVDWIKIEEAKNRKNEK